MTRKLILCFLFFTVSPFALLLSIYFLSLFGDGRVLGEAVSLSSLAMSYSGQVLASSTENIGVIAPTVIAKDSTSILIEKYLKHYQSPLLPYKDKILEASEKYGVQPQLIVAIAQQESNLGKKTPENCYNAWGWGIHAQGTKCFASWEEAVEIVIKGIARDYCAKGYCSDPCVMMEKYTPRSNGSWCAGVKQFLAELETGDF